MGLRFGGFVWGRCGVGVGLFVCVVVLFGGCVGGPLAAPVLAPAPAPAWEVTDVGSPSVLPVGVVGKQGRYGVVVENVGGASSSGGFTVKAQVPAGFSVTGLAGEPNPEECSEGAGEVSCKFSESIVPSGFVVMRVFFEVTGSVSSVSSVASVNGGGAVEASSEADMRLGVGHEVGPAGVAQFRFGATGPAGEAVTQAGGHPNFLTTSVLFNNLYDQETKEPAKPVGSVKDLAFYLPLGMLGDPAVTEPCPASLVEIEGENTGCPPASRVGSILPLILSQVLADWPDPTHVHGIYSITPEHGFAAEFAFASNHYTFDFYASVVRHNGVYTLRVETPGIVKIAFLIGLIATFYGAIKESFTSDGEPVTFERGSFLTDPMDCEEGAAEREASVASNTWEDPDPTLPFTGSAPGFASIEGCGLLGFSSGLSVKPQTTQADSPSGYEVGLEVPQAPNDASGLGTPPARNVSVTLPVGTAISPSSANGLEACQESGPDGINIEGAESEEIGVEGMERPAAGRCPAASQIGTVTASTPLLHEPLPGKLFIAEPQCGGAGQAGCSEEDARDGRLFAMYLELNAPVTGIIIKLKGTASVNPQSGQITVTFDDNPQFPFSKLTVATTQGARAPLANSQACGAATSSAEVTPWSAPSTQAATPSDYFNVDWDGAGGACPGSAPFAPSFTAGTTTPLAAATSPFTFTLKREDREQDIASLSSTLPEGLLAYISKVERCGEPQASQDSLTACPAASQIGTTTVAVGSGSDPYYVTGKVFFTGPYGGAPFGLSVVVPAVAGPFNLGDVLVRVALFVDPHTARVTAVSGPLPQILDGVPLRIRTLNVTLENREFVLNPTSCSPASVTGTVYSTTGATASVSSPFAVAGCKNLAFAPVLSASTTAKSTKANGTEVKVKIAYPASGQANIAKVVLSFPKKLPVRIETLRQACRAATFEANPAACPPDSAVGSATVHTPILAQPLKGPAYLVSYGSAKFPDVVFVLQGEGVTLEVDGQSFVSSSGVLKVTFSSVPDAPFSSFETVLPAKRYSQFTSVKSTGKAQASQCGENMIAPVQMTAYNGAEITKNVKLQITGCKHTKKSRSHRNSKRKTKTGKHKQVAHK